MNKKINIGLIGHKFMGKAHSHAYRDINMFFKLPFQVVPHTLCGVGNDLDEIAGRYGFINTEEDWKKVVSNPDIDVIDICTPDSLHREIAIAAAKAGKHIICEKPLTVDYRSSKEMCDEANRNGIKTLCNFTYRGVPAIRLIKKLIDQDKIGKLYTLKMQYLQDFSLSPQFPFVWRMDNAFAGPGIFGDKGSHLIDMTRYFFGEFASVCSMSRVYINSRRDLATGALKEISTPDCAMFMAKLECGAMAFYEISNMAAGRKNAFLIEINGEKGSILFDLERLNEIQYFNNDDPPDQKGFKTILVTEQEHEFIPNWWPSGHVLGWEHTFIHQFHDFFMAVSGQQKSVSCFEDGSKCQQIVDATVLSDKLGRWVRVNEIV
ncbi:MAG: Gfo/Idh/MocA family oxidoreductase [Treponema sp.]|nr:Gfo/Idh/MocA family oxidoreductase [Treponema sp.]